MTLPRAVVVHRPTEYDGLLARHGTHGQAAFFLKARGRDIGHVVAAHERQNAAMASASAAIPRRWRRAMVARDDLSRFSFSPDDVVLAVGQDGLVPNVAKYLRGQAVIGINPDKGRYDGVLVLHEPDACADLLRDVSAGRASTEARAMVRGELSDGQRILALNELFIGHRSHQSARYTIRLGEVRERHSSSGVVVATGTGGTGWARSICLARGDEAQPLTAQDTSLQFFVREAFPSVRTQTSLTTGVLREGDALTIRSEMEHGGTVFGDGVEPDALVLPWGETVTVQTADVTLCLVV